MHCWHKVYGNQCNAGTVTKSFLVAPAEASPHHSPHAIHKIIVTPFQQDFCQDISTWGLLFNFHIIAGMISPTGLGLPQGVKVKAIITNCVSFSQLPFFTLLFIYFLMQLQLHCILKSVSSPLVTVSTEVALHSYDDISMLVPVCDGRASKDHKAFGFTDSDFKWLSSWLLYWGGQTEVPLDAVVLVGYTVDAYCGYSGPVLSSNLLFAISPCCWVVFQCICYLCFDGSFG